MERQLTQMTHVEGWRCLEERSLDFLTRLFTTDDA